MNVLFFIVNFRADAALLHCLESLTRAAATAPECINLSVHVFDNSEYSGADREKLARSFEEVMRGQGQLHWSERNAGYFGGLWLAQRLAIEGSSDVVIYSNPDIMLDKDFFTRLELLSYQGGILAPAIVSQQDGFDQNPKYLARLPRAKLERLQKIYNSRLGFLAFTSLARVKERLMGSKARNSTKVATGTAIYAPHGATFVFADVDFFCTLPHYPVFLFGEELFVAEEARRCGITVRYCPELIVSDQRSQSIAQLPSESFRQFMLSSVGYILQQYYYADNVEDVQHK